MKTTTFILILCLSTQAFSQSLDRIKAIKNDVQIKYPQALTASYDFFLVRYFSSKFYDHSILVDSLLAKMLEHQNRNLEIDKEWNRIAHKLYSDNNLGLLYQQEALHIESLYQQSSMDLTELKSLKKEVLIIKNNVSKTCSPDQLKSFAENYSLINMFDIPQIVRGPDDIPHLNMDVGIMVNYSYNLDDGKGQIRGKPSGDTGTAMMGAGVSLMAYGGPYGVAGGAVIAAAGMIVSAFSSIRKNENYERLKNEISSLFLEINNNLRSAHLDNNKNSLGAIEKVCIKYFPGSDEKSNQATNLWFGSILTSLDKQIDLNQNTKNQLDSDYTFFKEKYKESFSDFNSFILKFDKMVEKAYGGLLNDLEKTERNLNIQAKDYVVSQVKSISENKKTLEMKSASPHEKILAKDHLLDTLITGDIRFSDHEKFKAINWDYSFRDKIISIMELK